VAVELLFRVQVKLMEATNFSNAYEIGLNRTIAFLLSRGIKYDDAQDVAQTAWLRGWERLLQLRDDRMLLPWVNTIALNHYRRTLRTMDRYEEWKPAYENASTTVLDCAAIDISRILDACKPKDRDLLEAHLRGESPKEMAEREGVSPTAIRIRLLRARRSARELCEAAVSLPQAA
jgi:RNA polymerase sigma factor (sigma-70 family)